MGYEVKITSRANRDLVEILDYIASCENDAGPAIRFANALVEEALSLAELAYRGRIMNRRKRIRKLVFHKQGSRSSAGRREEPTGLD
jgi:plasmid stabilization system protein ParE